MVELDQTVLALATGQIRAVLGTQDVTIWLLGRRVELSRGVREVVVVLGREVLQ